MNIYDYLNISENLTGKKPEEVINLVKRYNNPKRDFLFENKFLGKTYPQKAREILKHFQLLFDLVVDDLKDQRILIVGFAETATGLAQYFSHVSKDKLNVVYHLQTTREKLIDTEKLEFLEEHSHAAHQEIIFNDDIPEFDTILFVEDEISTGNTIINFIKQFNSVRPETKYSVATLFNWQNETDTQKYKDMGIKTYSLIRGTMKESITDLKVDPSGIEVYSTQTQYTTTVAYGLRLGMSVSDLNKHFEMKTYSEEPNALVIGTEENMYKPILFAEQLDAEFMSTTRSPLVVSQDENYYPRFGALVPSLYASDRKTFIYNLNKKYDKIYVVMEYSNKEFIDSISPLLNQYSDTVIFVNERDL